MLRAALAARLERVRGGLTDAEFAHLVDDVMRTSERFEQIDADHCAGTARVPGAPPPSQRPTVPTESPVAKPSRGV